VPFTLVHAVKYTTEAIHKPEKAETTQNKTILFIVS